MKFDLTDLRLFCEVVDAGSITAGAERSAIALAAASTRIRGMEQSLGSALLVRSRHGVTPTPAGLTLLKHARTMLAQSARLREDLSAYAGGASGEVRLLANTNALTEFLPEALSLFLAEHPHVSVDLEERLSDEIVGLVAEGAADIGIVAGTVDVGALATYPFRSDRFVVVTAQDHPLAQRSSVGFVEVLAFDFVGLERSSSLQRFLTTKAAREGRPLKARGATPQLRCGLPPGGGGRRRGRRAANDRQARGEDHVPSRSSTSPTTGRCGSSRSSCAPRPTFGRTPASWWRPCAGEAPAQAASHIYVLRNVADALQN